MSNDGLNKRLDDCSDAELACRVVELEATGWIGQLKAIKPNATGIDAFARGFVAGQRFVSSNSRQSRQVVSASLLWLQTRTAVWSAVLSAALTWLVVSAPTIESPIPNETMHPDAPLAAAVVEQPSTNSEAIEYTRSIEEFIPSPWRERALVMKQAVRSSEQTDLLQSMPDTEPDSLRYIKQRSQWLINLQNAP